MLVFSALPIVSAYPNRLVQTNLMSTGFMSVKEEFPHNLASI